MDINKEDGRLSDKKNVISIHQPGYIPWLGFFKKIQSSDIFVFLDDVQFEKNGWQNRNKIKTSENWMWLTVPVNAKLGMKLNEIQIDYSSNWINKHKKSIELNYAKSKFFEKYWPDFKKIYEKEYELLIDLNMEFIKKFMEMLNIRTKTILSSSLEITQKKSARILQICQSLNTSKYISGIMGKDYLDLNDFENNKIDVILQNYQHPTYLQKYEPFLPNMSIMDLLLNEGNNAVKILEESNNT